MISYLTDMDGVLHREGKGGLWGAYRAGFAWGLERDYEVLCEMDADGSHAPEQFHLLLEKLEDGADVVILSGAPLAGLAAKVRDRIPVPVVDPVAAAVRQAETLAMLKPRKAVAGTFRRPDPKPTRGLAAPLAAIIEHRSPKEGTS